MKVINKKVISKDIVTYHDLLKSLQNLTKKQLSQPVQITDPSYNDDTHPCELMQVIAIDTVDAFGFQKVRSSVDNKYHPEEVVLLTDRNSFAEDGTFSYLVDESGIFAQYDKNGPTKPEEQTRQKISM